MVFLVVSLCAGSNGPSPISVNQVVVYSVSLVVFLLAVVITKVEVLNVVVQLVRTSVLLDVPLLAGNAVFLDVVREVSNEVLNVVFQKVVKL